MSDSRCGPDLRLAWGGWGCPDEAGVRPPTLWLWIDTTSRGRHRKAQLDAVLQPCNYVIRIIHRFCHCWDRYPRICRLSAQAPPHHRHSRLRNPISGERHFGGTACRPFCSVDLIPRGRLFESPEDAGRSADHRRTADGPVPVRHALARLPAPRRAQHRLLRRRGPRARRDEHRAGHLRPSHEPLDGPVGHASRPPADPLGLRRQPLVFALAPSRSSSTWWSASSPA